LVDDELNPVEETEGVNQIENQDTPQVEESGEGLALRVTELEGLVAQRDEELTRANSHITELEQAVAESEERFKTTTDSLAKALANYKAMVMQANPGVPEELINGDNIESINESLGKAKGIISQVRQGLEAEIQAVKIPTGAPQRVPPDLSALTPREKIQYAIGGKK